MSSLFTSPNVHNLIQSIRSTVPPLSTEAMAASPLPGCMTARDVETSHMSKQPFHQIAMEAALKLIKSLKGHDEMVFFIVIT